MISRKTTNIIAESYKLMFEKPQTSGSGYGTSIYYVNDYRQAYDFFFEHDYPAWMCNKIRRVLYGNAMKLFIQQIHTGEILAETTPSWGWKEREKKGQDYLFLLAEDYLQLREEANATLSKQLISSLELDGYQFKNGRLLQSEETILDIEEYTGVLHSLYKELRLQESDMAFEFLRLSEEHYLNKLWSDSIANSRKFVEHTMSQVAVRWGAAGGNAIAASDLTYPVRVREYLQREDLLEVREKDMLQSLYGVLSNTGSHPYIADNDQARLLRQMALTYTQFVMLRLKGKLAANGKI